jgi:integrase/recombinase XerD
MAGASNPSPPIPMSHAKLGRPQASSPISRPQAADTSAASVLLSDSDLQLLDHLDARNADFLEHAEHAEAHSRFTIALYKQTWANYRRFLIDQHASVERTVAGRLVQLDQWNAWNHRRGIQPITINSYWRTLRPFFNYLERVEGMPNPFRTSPAPKFQRPDPKALRPEQMRRVLDAARNYPWRSTFLRTRAAALVGIMLFAGLRRTEVLRLEAEDVNLDDGTLHVLKGKGRYGGKPRTAYMLPELLPLLRAYVSEKRRCGYHPPEFFASGPGTGLSYTQFRRIMRLIRDAAGVQFTPHSLRHSYITLLVRNRVPLHAVQAFAGHADLETTQRYVRLFDDDLQRYARHVRLS